MSFKTFGEMVPELAAGKRIKAVEWKKGNYIAIIDHSLQRHHDEKLFRVTNSDFTYWLQVYASPWEIAEEEIEVADYFVESSHGYILEDNVKLPIYVKRTFEIGKAPDVAIIIPNSGRKVKK